MGGWTSGARLRVGERVTVRQRGHSLRGKVTGVAIVRVGPPGDRVLAAGDVVRCMATGRQHRTS